MMWGEAAATEYIGGWIGVIREEGNTTDLYRLYFLWDTNDCILL